ncbi:MAG: globin [Phycisphaerae bacterium]|mgnify:CR=1 FL=1|nr:globin [Phycisphaerae bacterium]
MEPLTPSIFERLGGAPAFWRIARAFYARVDADPTASFRSMFPADLDEAVRNQAEFLMQYFGGPQTYSERKGHPRLRIRHAPFAIDMDARQSWMGHMRGALEDANIPEPERAQMLDYFHKTSLFLINRD